jgi:uncharacterized protein (DUF697 family)
MTIERKDWNFASRDSAMLERITRWFTPRRREDQFQEWFAKLRAKTPVPAFWLLGRTQSGKTSVIKYLTGADEAEIGQGFRPCTRFSRLYQFPSSDAPLLAFMDTRGLDEPGYDAAEDLARFDKEAHVVIVTVKALDHAQENLLANLPKVRRSRPDRPIVLALTCLHEAYPQQQHPEPYAFGTEREKDMVPADLARSLEEQKRRFAGLYDHVVPVDLTPAAEGFHDPNYGGPRLREVLLEALPGAYRQTLANLEEAKKDLREAFGQNALPRILGYSSLAASAGALPIPWLDLVLLPGIQTRLIYSLADYYGQRLTGARFAELAGTLGLGVAMRQATRELLKFIPYVGSVAGAALAGASTFALGKAFCYYYEGVLKGHVPRAEELRQYYREQLALAERFWMRGGKVEAISDGVQREPS